MVLWEGVEWEGTAAGKYASQLLKAGCAAHPGGCSARFVPACVCALVFEPWDGVGEDGMGVRSGG